MLLSTILRGKKRKEFRLGMPIEAEIVCPQLNGRRRRRVRENVAEEFVHGKQAAASRVVKAGEEIVVHIDVRHEKWFQTVKRQVFRVESAESAEFHQSVSLRRTFVREKQKRTYDDHVFDEVCDEVSYIHVEKVLVDKQASIAGDFETGARRSSRRLNAWF